MFKLFKSDNWFTKIKDGLAKTRQNFTAKVKNLFVFAQSSPAGECSLRRWSQRSPPWLLSRRRSLHHRPFCSSG